MKPRRQKHPDQRRVPATVPAPVAVLGHSGPASLGAPDRRPTNAVDPTPAGHAITDDLAFRAVVGEVAPEDAILRIVGDRIRAAAKHLRLTREDLLRIFGTYSLLETEVTVPVAGADTAFLMVEAHHLMAGKVGKGALKIMLGRDLPRESPLFVEVHSRTVEVRPPAPQPRWDGPAEAWGAVRSFFRELITGETLSMSLKSQATGAPFAGSEGILLCAAGEFEAATGRFFLKPVTTATDAGQAHDKELLEALMNAAAVVLTRTGRIAHDRIVHAAETNSTLTARLHLQLPGNVVEGHLRALLLDAPQDVIGDEDMTVRLRRILNRPDYQPTACALAQEAARLQLDHSILALETRERLRHVLDRLPAEGQPTPEQFQDLVSIFFGAGETQQTEDQVFHHREPILQGLAAALAAGRLDTCEDPQVLALYLRVLLDNPVKMMKAALRNALPRGETLPPDWIETYPLFRPEQAAALENCLPTAEVAKAEVKHRFAEVLKLLIAFKDAIPASTDNRFLAARMAVIAQAIRAITAGGDLIPAVERIRFFVTPFTFECLTPKLGVVTRKPLQLCGSELRPHAMAAGAIFAIEELMRTRGAARSKPLAGLTVAIQGLGNAGKGVARIMRQRGARILAVSDSRGVLIAPAGLNERELTAVLDHKSAGKRLDTFPLASAAGATCIRHRDPETLLTVKADVLVLTAKPASIHEDNAGQICCKIICELTGAAVTSAAKVMLAERSIAVIPDNLGSSGGLLVSLSEMLQNSLGQQWERELEETTLRQQMEQSYEASLKLGRKHGLELAAASDLLALKRMHALAIYRENLHAAAGRLREQIRSIGDGETVLLVSDDDDDGVASAAIFCGLLSHLNPGRESQVVFVNESLRSRAVLDVIEAHDHNGGTVKRVFVLDRAFPLSPAGQDIVMEIARRCPVTLVNNHDLPEALLRGELRSSTKARSRPVRSPADLGILLITPQTLKTTIAARHFTTALVLRELAHQLLSDPRALARVDWQAAIGSCLDVPTETNDDWRLFYAQFNADEMLQAARAIRMVARAHGFMSAIQAVQGVERPDQLETNAPWEQFMNAYQLLAQRVQLLVEKIVMENVGRPYVSHLFTLAEALSPVPPVGGETRCLDLYPWISEHLTKRSDFGDKPIIVGQVFTDRRGGQHLGVRIRSPRGVDLMEVGLPAAFRTGGLPNTAVARLALDGAVTPAQQFQSLVENVWWKTVSPTIQLKKSNPEP